MRVLGQTAPSCGTTKANSYLCFMNSKERNKTSVNQTNAHLHWQPSLLLVLPRWIIGLTVWCKDHRYQTRFRLNSLVLPAEDGNPSLLCGFFCLSLFCSFFFSLCLFVCPSICLTQLIIQMSTARSLPSKGVAGMFSTVPFLFVMWNQSPSNVVEVSSVNSPHCCSAN